MAMSVCLSVNDQVLISAMFSNSLALDDFGFEELLFENNALRFFLIEYNTLIKDILLNILLFYEFAFM